MTALPVKLIRVESEAQFVALDSDQAKFHERGGLLDLIARVFQRQVIAVA